MRQPIRTGATMTQIVSAEPQPASVGLPEKGPFLRPDRETFLTRLNTRACFLHHQLIDHPLLAMPRLLELAKQLPPKYVRINSGNVPVDAAPAQIPGNGLSMEESFHRIHDS